MAPLPAATSAGAAGEVSAVVWSVIGLLGLVAVAGHQLYLYLYHQDDSDDSEVAEAATGTFAAARHLAVVVAKFLAREAVALASWVAAILRGERTPPRRQYVRVSQDGFEGIDDDDGASATLWRAPDSGIADGPARGSFSAFLDDDEHRQSSSTSGNAGASVSHRGLSGTGSGAASSASSAARPSAAAWLPETSAAKAHAVHRLIPFGGGGGAGGETSTRRFGTSDSAVGIEMSVAAHDKGHGIDTGSDAAAVSRTVLEANNLHDAPQQQSLL